MRINVKDIVNNPSKHIVIKQIDGKDTICYSQQFVAFLEQSEKLFDVVPKIGDAMEQYRDSLGNCDLAIGAEKCIDIFNENTLFLSD